MRSAPARNTGLLCRRREKLQELLAGSRQNHLVANRLDVLHIDLDLRFPESMSKVVSVGDVFFELNPEGEDIPSLFVELKFVHCAELLSLRTDYLPSDNLRT